MPPSPYGDCIVVHPAAISAVLSSWSNLYQQQLSTTPISGTGNMVGNDGAGAGVDAKQHARSACSDSAAAAPPCRAGAEGKRNSECKEEPVRRRDQKNNSIARGKVVDESEKLEQAFTTLSIDPVKNASAEESSKNEVVRPTEDSAKAAASSSSESKVKKPLLKPKDILMSSRQKSHILAHKSKTISASAVPQDVLTHDLLGSGCNTKSANHSPTKCRDDKNLEDITREFDQFSLKANRAAPVAVNAGAGKDGERIQRSPIPVNVLQNARLNPYQVSQARYLVRQQPHHQMIDLQQQQQWQWSWQNGPQTFVPGCYPSQPAVASVPRSHSDEMVANQSGCAYNVVADAYSAGYSSDVPSVQSSHSMASPCSYQSPHPYVDLQQQLSVDNRGSGCYSNQTSAYDAVSESEEERVSARSAKSDETDQQDGTLLPEQLTDFIFEYSKDFSSDDEATSTSVAEVAPKYPIDLQVFWDGEKKPVEAANEGAQAEAKRSDEEKAAASCESNQPAKKTAKQTLREMIGADQFNEAWIWALKCSQAFPGALYYRDRDGDSFLHIVVWHKDLAKIYALTELMNRDDTHSVSKPFDLHNDQGETPLFLAVEKRLKDVVAYGLENSDNPNIQAANRLGDTPLHFAAARGMVEIVQLFCQCPLVDTNLTNGLGLTPTLLAVKSHLSLVDNSTDPVNNKGVLHALLSCGADTTKLDSSTGKSIFHYAVESMDPSIIEVIRDHVDKETIQTVVNQRCFDGETPLQLLCRMSGAQADDAHLAAGPQLRAQVFTALINCGAEIPRTTAGSGGADSPDFFIDDGTVYF